MEPKLWPKRLVYSRESVAAEMHLFLLQSYLYSGSSKDFEQRSWIIEEKCTYPHLEIKKTSSSVLKDQNYHPLWDQKTLKGHQNYGIFSTQKINSGTEIGEYVGEQYLANDQKSLQRVLKKISPSEYAWVIEIKHFFLVIDAQNIANELALINDYRGIDLNPNVKMHSLIHKGDIYFAYVAICDIQEGKELLVDYGQKFWNAYYKTKF